MAQTTVGKLRFNPRSTWVSATSYDVDDMVVYKNRHYMCTVANSSTTVPPLNTAQWSEIGGGTYFAGEYSAATAYAIGDIVTYTQILTYNNMWNYKEVNTYICIQAGTGQTPSTATSYWKIISSGTMRDKFAFLANVNSGYVPGYKSTWDTYALSTTVGMGDSVGEFKTPGSCDTYYGGIKYITKRYTLGTLGNNSNHSNGAGQANDSNFSYAEGCFVNQSWHDGVLPTSPTTQAPRIIQVEAAQHSSLVLFDNGEVHHAGYNGHGQHGVGTTEGYYTGFVQCGYGNINRSGATSILRSKKAIRIASSAEATDTQSCYALIRNSDDTRELYAWGYNGYGQLGQGNTSDYYAPTLVSFDQATNGKIIEIWACGGNYASMFFLTDQGKMYAMGYNGNGNLGVGDTSNRSSPTLVKTWGTGSTNKIKKFNTAGGANSGSATTFLVIRGDNSLWTWGYNGQGQCAHGHTYAVASPMQVYTGGYTGLITTQSVSNPGTASGTAITDTVNAWLAGGNYGSLYVTRGTNSTNNTLYASGYNGYYQLGNNTTTDRSTLAVVTMLNGANLTNVVDLAANTGDSSYGNTAVLRSNNEWYFAGYHNAGAWANGCGDTWNDRQDRDPSGLSSNYRYKNNMLFPHAKKNTDLPWKYVPYGRTSYKYGMYIDMNSGRVYTTGYGNDYNFYNDWRGTYTTVPQKLKGQ